MPNTPVCLIPQCAYWGQAVPCGTFHLRGSGEVHTGKCDVGGVVLYLYVMTKKNSAVPYMHTTHKAFNYKLKLPQKLAVSVPDAFLGY